MNCPFDKDGKFHLMSQNVWRTANCRGSSPYIDIGSIYIYHLGHTVLRESKDADLRAFALSGIFNSYQLEQSLFSYIGCLEVFFISFKEHSVSKEWIHRSDAWPRGYDTFFMLNSTEHEISTAHKNLNTDKSWSFLL